MFEVSHVFDVLSWACATQRTLRRAIAHLQTDQPGTQHRVAQRSRAASARHAVALEKQLHTCVSTAEAALAVVLTSMQQVLARRSAAGAGDDARELLQRALIVQVRRLCCGL